MTHSPTTTAATRRGPATVSAHGLADRNRRQYGMVEWIDHAGTLRYSTHAWRR